MSLSHGDFVSEFKERELKEIPLETMGGRTIFMRSLPYAQVWEFKVLANKIQSRRSGDIFNGSKSKLVICEDDKMRAEEYLISESCCNPDGSKFFESVESFNEWRLLVSPDVVAEILFHIKELTNLSDEFKPENSIEERIKIKKK